MMSPPVACAASFRLRWRGFTADSRSARAGAECLEMCTKCPNLTRLVLSISGTFLLVHDSPRRS